MCDAASEIRISYAHSSEVAGININRFHFAYDCALFAILGHASIVDRLGELWEIVILITYEDLYVSRAGKGNMINEFSESNILPLDNAPPARWFVDLSREYGKVHFNEIFKVQRFGILNA